MIWLMRLIFAPLVLLMAYAAFENRANLWEMLGWIWACAVGVGFWIMSEQLHIDVERPRKLKGDN